VMKLMGRERVYQVGIYVLVFLLLVGSIFPLFYVVCVSLTTDAEVMERGSLMLVPHHPSLEAYERIFLRNGLILHSFWVSVLRTAVGTLCTLGFTIIAGYATSRRDMPGSRLLMFLVMITVLFDGGMIPTFLVVKSTGLYNNFWAMVIPGLLDSWSVLVFRQFFMNLPKEVEEAAEVDGVSKVRLFFTIVLPMSTAVMAALGLFMAVGHWNAWFDAMLYIKDDDFKPLQLVLYNMHKDANMGYNVNELNDFTGRVSTRSLRMALTVIGTVPILCVYPFLQKYFTKGVYVGSVKG
jgi:putative aldouronate transport system permease protein